MRSVSWRRIILISAVSVTVLICVFTGIFLLSGDQPAQAADTPPVPMYTVRDYRGFVAVFPGVQSVPSFVTDTAVKYLPAADQQSLQAGIPIYSQSALDALLEDYCS